MLQLYGNKFICNFNKVMSGVGMVIPLRKGKEPIKLRSYGFLVGRF